MLLLVKGFIFLNIITAYLVTLTQAYVADDKVSNVERHHED